MSKIDHYVIKCCVSHLPAGHPNACGDCDPCLMHNRSIQLAALYRDWEDMYWKLAALPDLIEAAKEFVEAQEAFNDMITKMEGWVEPVAEQARLTLAYRALRSALSKGGLRDG